MFNNQLSGQRGKPWSVAFEDSFVNTLIKVDFKIQMQHHCGGTRCTAVSTMIIRSCKPGRVAPNHYCENRAVAIEFVCLKTVIYFLSLPLGFKTGMTGITCQVYRRDSFLSILLFMMSHLFNFTAKKVIYFWLGW